jgi:hypothetical protein
VVGGWRGIVLLAMAIALSLVACGLIGGESSGQPAEPAPPTVRTAPPGGFPDASTTGVPPNTVLVPSAGDITLTAPGMVVDGLEVHGCITVAADDVVIRNTLVTCGGPYGIRNFSDGRDNHNLLVEDVEITCGDQASRVAIAFSNYTARRVNVHGCEDGLRAGDSVLVEDSYIHDLVTRPGSQNDGIQSDGGQNLTIRHNRIENRFSQTSAILMSTNTAPINHVVVENNLLVGGGYTIYAGTDVGGPVPDMKVLNNRFSRMFFPNGGYWNPVTATGPTTVWSGNVWDDTGQPVTP